MFFLLIIMRKSHKKKTHFSWFGFILGGIFGFAGGAVWGLIGLVSLSGALFFGSILALIFAMTFGFLPDKA
jgi:hypothetical protein